MKIALIGASGLAGSHIARAGLARNHEIHAFYNARKPAIGGLELHQLDLTEPENAVGPLLELFPDVIINAAAISSPADCDAEPERAEKLNVALPRRLAQVAHHLGCRLIHLSTDMVFDGQSGTPYRSTDLPNPIGLYGQLKLLAEREVLEHGVDEVTVLRIPILTATAPPAPAPSTKSSSTPGPRASAPPSSPTKSASPSPPPTSANSSSSCASVATFTASFTGPATKPSPATKWAYAS